jgi:hypothetical protein
MEATNGIKVWQWIVTVIVIAILVFLGYKMFSGSPKTNTDVVVENTDTSTTDNSTDSNRVVVLDQFPGNIVYISSVQLAKPGFVVIKGDKSGIAGDVIGYQYFDKGINPGKITLTKSTVDGGIYYAQLYVDDGDKKFDLIKDLPIKDQSGNDIMKLFKVSTNVSEVKG